MAGQLRKNFRKRSRKSDGFSMIELLIGVAIIGIVGSIAMPAYRNYTVRARQIEAKSNLTTIYAVQKSFKAEFAYYAGCLSTIGYEPSGARRNYTIGFSWGFTGHDVSPTRSVANCDTQPSSGDLPNQTWFLANSFVPPVMGLQFATNVQIPADSGVEPSRFLVYAVGRPGASPTFDYWSIDNKKNLMISSAAGSTSGGVTMGPEIPLD